MGRDSPGNKYESIHTIGNASLINNSKIKKSKFYSMPKEKRELKFKG